MSDLPPAAATQPQEDRKSDTAVPESSEDEVHSEQSKELDKEKAFPTAPGSGNPAKDDPNAVWWDGPDDPQNPMNWSSALRWTNVMIISFMTLTTPLASSMFAPGVPLLMAEFHSTSTLIASFVVSIYVLGFAVGPLILAPLSEIYGRLPIYHAANIGFTAFTIACALAKNINQLMVFRFFEGCFGSAVLTNFGGSVADMVPSERRGAVMAILSLGPLFGPVIGPVGGGFLAEAKGWRWVFWVITILGGTLTITGFLFLRESYAPVILQKKAKKLQKETNNPNLHSALDRVSRTPGEVFVQAINRPIKLLILSPILSLMTLYLSVIYGELYLLFTTFSFTFEGVYGIKTNLVGLTFLGIGIGSLLGLGLFGGASDPIVRRLTARNGGVSKPEYRLPPLMVGGFFTPIGLFWFGWTAEKHVMYVVPIVGTLFFGLGMISAFMAISTYLVDVFGVYSASALAANTLVRSLAGAFLPLAGQSMYEKLGLGWGNSLLAFIALAMVPLPFFFYVWGERIRARFDMSTI